MKIICTQQLNNIPAGCNDLHITKSKLGNRKQARNGIPPKRPWRSLVVQILRKGRDQGKMHALGYCMVMEISSVQRRMWREKGNGEEGSEPGHFPGTEAEHSCGVARLFYFGYFLVSMGGWSRRLYTLATGIDPCLPGLQSRGQHPLGRWLWRGRKESGERSDFLMVPTWTHQCCDMRDTPSPWGATHISKAVWTGRDATGDSPAPVPSV